MSKHPSANPSPPRWADRFLEWYCSPELIDEIQGDLYESFHANIGRMGYQKAKWLYIFYVIRFFRPSSFSKLTFDFYPAMYRNYLTTALRNFWREKGYTFINISGLSVGLACSILIMLWVQDELNVDGFHEQEDQLFQVNRHVTFENDKTYTWSSVPKPLAHAMEREIPEILDAELMSWQNEFLISIGDQTFRESGRYLDTAFFDMFTFPLLEGDQQHALDDPSS
ncbi:MAG: ABC transporter permease, partial [Bacteroidetes bacterium]|nr:ABC transporter permease [Bacteroidota bacterium]